MKAIPKRTLLVTCIIILLPMFVGLAMWNQLPERMPTHFNFSGEVDGYSGRPFAVIGLPLFILAMQLFCAVMLRADPKKQNISEKLVQLTLWICPAVSLFVGISMYLSALGFAINVSRLGMVFVGLIFIVIGNYLPKCRHNYTVGIRLPWTTRITGITPTVSRAMYGSSPGWSRCFPSSSAMQPSSGSPRFLSRPSRRSSIRSFTRKGTEKSEFSASN